MRVSFAEAIITRFYVIWSDAIVSMGNIRLTSSLRFFHNLTSIEQMQVRQIIFEFGLPTKNQQEEETDKRPGWWCGTRVFGQY